ncbi:MAG: hypothetical protein OSA81_12530 [Longimicrobiales bacterium]|nr:hypothetical protein [Longimicrobiales bacterium]
MPEIKFDVLVPATASDIDADAALSMVTSETRTVGLFPLQIVTRFTG